MAECSEHLLNGLATIFATIEAVNAQLLQSNLLIMLENANYLPSASDADKDYRVTRNRSPVADAGFDKD